MRIFLILFIFIFLNACEKETIIAEKEVEPNNSFSQASAAGKIVFGKTYYGKISKPKEGIPDQDIFYFSAESGKMYNLTFESREKNFNPKIVFEDASLKLRGVTFQGNHKNNIKVIAPFSSYIYFTVEDLDDSAEIKNFEREYWFRIDKENPCDEKSYTLNSENELRLKLDHEKGGMTSVDISSENGNYGIYIDSMDEDITDKLAILIRCATEEIVAGNDDRKPLAGEKDPYLFMNLSGGNEYKLFVYSLYSDTSKITEENFKVYMEKQQPDSELEPNDLIEMSNIPESFPFKGHLESRDTDYIEIPSEKGSVTNISLESDAEGSVTFEIIHYTSENGAISTLELRNLTAEITKENPLTLNAFIPFYGRTFLKMSSTDTLNYELNVKTSQISEELEGENPHTFETQSCESVYFRTVFGSESGIMRIETVPNVNSSIYVYDDKGNFLISDLYTSHSYLYNYKWFSTDTCIVEIQPEKCTGSLIFKADVFLNEVSKPEIVSFEKSIEAEVPGSYKGYIDTANSIIENILSFTAKNDGRLTIMTMGCETESNIQDTMLSLTENGIKIASNDDMNRYLPIRYSLIRATIKKDNEYIVTVSPFMDESSDPESMNISGCYIVDLWLDE